MNVNHKSPLFEIGLCVAVAVVATALLIALLASHARADDHSGYSAASYSVGSVADGYTYQSDGYWHRSGQRYTRTLTPQQYTYKTCSHGCWTTHTATYYRVVYDQVAYVAPKAYEAPKYEAPKYETPEEFAYREAARALGEASRRQAERKARNEAHSRTLELHAVGRELFGADYTPRIPGDGGFFQQQYGSVYAEHQKQVLTKREYRRIDIVDPNPLARALANSLKSAEENVNLAGDRARGAFKDAVDSASVVAERQASAQLLEAQALLERERGASDERRLRASASERQTVQTETQTQSVVPTPAQPQINAQPATITLDAVITNRCLKCHGGTNPSKDLDLSGGLASFSDDDQKRIVRAVWLGKMPLKDTKPFRLPINEVMAFLGGMTLDGEGKAAFIQELTEGK